MSDAARGPGAAARWIGPLILALLVGIALVLRLALDTAGVLDTDTINFGLAAFRFDILQHQPHPPGYPGYVLLLKGIHLVAPGLSPVDVAKWGSRLCGVAAVPAAYWAAGKLTAAVDRSGLRESAGEMAYVPVRRLAAAAFATVTPILWYYGADGQSHAAEALVTLLVFGGVADARSRPAPGRTRVLGLIGAFALAGAVRPTVVLLGFPIAIWLLWRRPALEWVLGAVVGVAATAAWLVPVVALTGGWDLYSRASEALFQIFYQSFSVFGSRTTGETLLANASAAAWAGAFCAIPAVALTRPARGAAWPRVILAVAVVNTGFYGLVYIAEAGYLSGVAALVCLLPASWPRPVPRSVSLRAAVALVGCVAVVLLGPANVPIPGGHEWLAPTLRHTVDVDAMQSTYHRLVCGATAGEPSLVITDNPGTTHTRALTVTCPQVVVGLYLHHHALQPRWDNWLLFDQRSMQVIPPPVPLEPGPPASGTLMRRVARVIVAPDASRALQQAIRAVASCRPEVRRTGRFQTLVFPSRCLPVIALGRNRLRIPGPR